MKTLVIFESKYGSTEKYATDIAKRVEADVSPFKKVKWKNIQDYDIVVFGSYIRGGKIQKIDDFLQHWDELKDKAVLVFATGMGMASKESRDNLIQTNVLGDYHLRFYQFRGSFDFSKLNFIDRLMFTQSLKIMEAHPELAGGNAQDMSWVKDNPIEVYDSEKVDRVVDVIQKIKLGEASK